MKERWKERKGERRERWIDKDRKEIKVERKEGRVEEKKDGLIEKERKGRNKERKSERKDKERKGRKSERNKLSSQLQHPRESQAQPLLDNHRHIHTKHQILTQPGSPRQQSKPSVTDTALQPHTSHTQVIITAPVTHTVSD